MKKISTIKKIVLISFVVFAFYLGNLMFFPHAIPNGSYRLIVDKNETITSITNELKQNNIIPNAYALKLLLRVLREDRKVAAGMYILRGSMSTWGIAERITNGSPDQISVSIIEGWSFEQLRNYINKIDHIQHITESYTEDELKNSLKINWPNLEGAFYPSTYFVAPNQTDLEIYQQSHRLLLTKLDELYNHRESNTVYGTPYQLLIMASLIQKETAKVEDMYMVSAVFNNRIRKKMNLQDDPAVFYGLKNQNKITRKDFQIDTPYNTYLHFGLPPTPICIPSPNALLAASKPLNDHDVLYFVAIGEGKTKFSKSYKEHKSAIHKYLKK